MSESMSGRPSHPAWSHDPVRPAWAMGNDGTNVCAPDLTLSAAVEPTRLAEVLWAREVVARGLQHLRGDSWATDAGELPEGDFNARFEHHAEALYWDVTRAGVQVVRAQLVFSAGRVAVFSVGRVAVWAAARTADAVDECVQRLREEVPPLRRAGEPVR